MEPALMMKTALALLSITAVGGVVMAVIRFRGETNPPHWLAMLHGLLAAAALTLLLYAFFTVGLPVLASWGLLLFVVAALGGVFLNLTYQTKSLPLPKAVVVLHAALAGIGYVVLLLAIMQSTR